MRIMQSPAAGATSALARDLHGAIVSDLLSLIAQVGASVELIEKAILDEARSGCPEIEANVVVLDDITPRYASTRAALKTCEAYLGAALCFLEDARMPQPGAKAAGGASPRVGLSGRA